MKFSCIFCRSKKSEQVSPKTRDSNKKIVKCKNCHLIQIFPLPTKSDEKKFYDKDLQTKLILKKVDIIDLEKRSHNDTSRRTRQIQKILMPNSTILDVGCGYGFQVRSLNDSNFIAVGHEVSEQRRKIAEKITKTEIISNNIIDSNNKGQIYNAITLFHVLEHVTNPVLFSKSLKSYLKPKGVLIIEVPNANDHMILKSTRYKDYFWQQAHISYFTSETVQKVLKKAGFKKIKVIGTQRYSFENAIYWMKFNKPEIDNPTYQTVPEFAWLEAHYKNHLNRQLISDTLWIEAKI